MFSNSGILPCDDDLQRRDTLWSTLFNKYSIDEGSDAELDDIYGYICDEAENDVNKDEEDLDISGDSMPDDDEDEDFDFDFEEVASQLKHLVEERVAAWPIKGVNLSLRTVDPSVTVEEWIQANSESTTTTEVEKTVIDKLNRTITKSTERTTITAKTIQIRIAPQAVKSNHRQQAGNIIKPVMGASSPQNKKSQSTDKNKSNAKVLMNQNKPKILKENSMKQQSSVRIPSGKSVATSKNIGNKLESTANMVPDRKGEQSTDKNEHDDAVPMQVPSTRLRRLKGRKVNAIHPEHVIENLVENTTQKNRKRNRVDTKRTKNERTDSITRLSSSSTVTPNYRKIKRNYDRLSNVVLSAIKESPATCDSEDSSEDDILSTDYIKLIENGEIF